MGKQSWPAVKKVTYKGGTPAYLVDTRVRGQGERLFFPTRTEADTAAEQARIRRRNEGNSAFAMLPSDRADAETALALLRPHGRTLREAAAFLLKHLVIVREELTVTGLIDELVENKKRDGASAPYLKDLRNRLATFANSLPRREGDGNLHIRDRRLAARLAGGAGIAE